MARRLSCSSSFCRANANSRSLPTDATSDSSSIEALAQILLCCCGAGYAPQFCHASRFSQSSIITDVLVVLEAGPGAFYTRQSAPGASVDREPQCVEV